ncbi:hypothetical protein NKG05_17865 [Oerskovia sp. M15]
MLTLGEVGERQQGSGELLTTWGSVSWRKVARSEGSCQAPASRFTRAIIGTGAAPVEPVPDPPLPLDPSGRPGRRSRPDRRRPRTRSSPTRT